MRARTHFEDVERGARQAIVIDEIPYQLNKKSLLEKIAELVHDKRSEGSAHVQDESDKSGMRVVIELKRGEVPEVVLNNLYKQTQLQDTFGINMVALVNGQPKLCNLKDLVDIFLQHRREVVTRRTIYTLRKARERGHVLRSVRAIGRDGVIGDCAALYEVASPVAAIVRFPGLASAIDATHFRAVVEQSAALREALMRNQWLRTLKAEQTVACNAAHSAEERLCRRLFQSRDQAIGIAGIDRLAERIAAP